MRRADVRHLLMHVKYRHWSKLAWHLRNGMVEPDEIVQDEATLFHLLDVLRVNGHLYLRSPEERDRVYAATQAQNWNGVEKVKARGLKMVSW